MAEDTAPLRVRVLLGVAAAVLAADVITKAIVVATLAGHAPVRLLGGVLTLQVLRNSGAAFNIGTSMTALFTLIAAGVIVFILRTARNLRSLPWAVTLGLLLGGATGNLVDRLARSPGPLRGYVVDWIQLPHWPVFNLADSAIVCGGALAILLSVRGTRIDGARDVTGEQPQEAGEQSPEAGAHPREAGMQPREAGGQVRAGGQLRGTGDQAPGAGEQPPIAGQATAGHGEESAASGVHGIAQQREGAPEGEVGGSGVRQP